MLINGTEYSYDWRPIPSFGDHDFQGFYERMVKAAPPNSTLLELGCFHGRSLVQLGLCAKAANKGLKIHGVDHAIDQSNRCADEVRKYIKASGLDDGTVTFHELKSVSAAKLFDDNSLWMVYLDAAHDHESVAEDIDAWMPKVSTFGWLCGHDSKWHSVWQVVKAKLDNVIHDALFDNVWLAKKQVAKTGVDIYAEPSPGIAGAWGYGYGMTRSDGLPSGTEDYVYGE